MDITAIIALYCTALQYLKVLLCKWTAFNGFRRALSLSHHCWISSVLIINFLNRFFQFTSVMLYCCCFMPEPLKPKYCCQPFPVPPVGTLFFCCLSWLFTLAFVPFIFHWYIYLSNNILEVLLPDSEIHAWQQHYVSVP